VKPTRRDIVVLGGGMAVGAVLSTFVSPERQARQSVGSRITPDADPQEEYVWASANAHLPLFVAHDHKALFLVGEELGVRVTITGPDTVDMPALITAVEETAARKPTGMMVVGWDPSALIPAINRAIDSGIPTICVDADVPGSKRLCFIGTDWYELGVRQGEAMVKALNGRRGKVVMLGLIEQAIDQRAFAGFRSVTDRAGLNALEPQQDKGNQAEAARVTGALIQAHSDLVGIAGFDSESGPGIGQAIREAGKAGQLVATCVDAEDQHLRLLKAGVLTACIGQKRELFTYYGVKALYNYVHAPKRLFPESQDGAHLTPIPANVDTGTFTVTRENVDRFLPGGK
jgi:ribose transport system substrate-binding protein